MDALEKISVSYTEFNRHISILYTRKKDILKIIINTYSPSIQRPVFIRSISGFLFKHPCKMLGIFKAQLISNFTD